MLESSHPARGAWIEMPWRFACSSTRSSRTPHGVRGLKYDPASAGRVHSGRTPHGVRGLKYVAPGIQDDQQASHPARGAWIEI